MSQKFGFVMLGEFDLADAIDIAKQYPQLLSNVSRLTGLDPQDLGLTEALNSIRHLTATAAELKMKGGLQQ